jgi:putative endonuclease
MYYIYFAKSLKNNKVYVGYTGKKPEERIKEHNQGSNYWSKLNKPLKLIYYESYFCREDAKLREEFFKMGFGKRIKKLIIQELGAVSSVG